MELFGEGDDLRNENPFIMGKKYCAKIVLKLTQKDQNRCKKLN
jgi:hypothetical protein